MHMKTLIRAVSFCFRLLQPKLSNLTSLIIDLSVLQSYLIASLLHQAIWIALYNYFQLKFGLPNSKQQLQEVSDHRLKGSLKG